MRYILTLLVIPAAVLAQAERPTEFPADAESVAADALRDRMTGKVYDAKTFDGATWRLQYQSNGYAFIDTSTGFRDSGKWRVEGSKLCSEWQKAPSGCSEARVKGDTVYVKRAANGEVVALVAK